MQDDADFAFSSFEEARARGGDFLATAWARIRAAEEERLLPMAAEGLERRPPSVGTGFRGPSSKADLPMSKQPKLRLRAAEDQPEQILQRVAGLKQAFMDAGVLKPRGDLNDAILNEWSTEVQRLAQDRVTQADKAAIVNAIRTYAELKHFRCVQKNWTSGHYWIVALRGL